MELVKKHVDTKMAIYSTLAIIAGVVLPQLFHIAGWTGPTFLPMHIPVLLAGFMLGPKYGLVVGMSSPLISSAITGMPVAFPMLPIMILELGTYGLISGLLSKKTKVPVVISLVITMLIGRISYAIVYYTILFAILPTISSNISPIGAVITGWPGIVIQILAIPIVVTALRRRTEK